MRQLSSRIVLFLTLAAACLTGQAETVNQNGFSYTISPTPAWVSDTPLPQKEVQPYYGLRQLLKDVQVSWMGERPVLYRRHVLDVVSATGLEGAAKDEVEFEPNYQSLHIHRMRVLRNGQWSDRLKGTIQLLRREQNLESNQYDGRVTASINMPDVRVGDRVEVAYSIEGGNPIFGKHRGVEIPVVSSLSTALINVRMLAPASSSLHYKMLGGNIAVDDQRSGNMRVLTVKQEQPSPWIPEDMVPAHALQFPVFQVTTFDDWAQVISWGQRLFEAPAPRSAEFAQKVAELKKLRHPEERIMAALNFVQEDIRYFGVEISVNSHEPHAPDQVITQRFGDCKDKTLLLHHLLKAVGITSTPALVSTHYRGALQQVLPGHGVFDHVILRLEHGGRVYWLDSTIDGQGHRLETVGQVDYGFALPLDSKSHSALDSARPVRKAPAAMRVREAFVAPDLSGRAELIVDIEYSLEQAEGMRRHFRARGKEEMQRKWLDSMARLFPRIEILKELVVDDDTRANVLRTREHYRVEDVFTYQDGIARFPIYATDLQTNLAQPDKSARRFPIALPQSFEASYDYELRSPFVRRFAESSGVTEDAHVRFSQKKSAEDGRLQFAMKLEYLKPEVKAADTATYLKTIKKIKADTSLTYQGNVLDTTAVEKEIGDEVRQRGALLQPADWREFFIKNTIKRTAWQRTLDTMNPAPNIEAQLLTYLGWVDLDLGEPERAEQSLRRIEAKPEHATQLHSLGAAVSLYRNQPEAGWRYYEENAASSSTLDWHDRRVGALLCVVRGRYDEAQRMLRDIIATDSEHQDDAARWLALTLRLQFGASPAAAAQWPTELYDLKSDTMSDALLNQPDKQLEKLGELYQLNNPMAASRLWLGLGLTAQKQGNTTKAKQYLQRVVDQRIGVLPEYMLARALVGDRVEVGKK